MIMLKYLCLSLYPINALQHYAMAGLSTCLVIHTQDPTAEFLLNCKIGNSPIACNSNLSALRFETTKVCFSTSYFPLSVSCRLI